MLRKKGDEYVIDRELTGKRAIEKNAELQEENEKLKEENRELKADLKKFIIECRRLNKKCIDFDEVIEHRRCYQEGIRKLSEK